jgi:hypothetical protein
MAESSADVLLLDAPDQNAQTLLADDGRAWTIASRFCNARAILLTDTAPLKLALHSKRYAAALGVDDIGNDYPEYLRLLSDRLGRHGYRASHWFYTTWAAVGLFVPAQSSDPLMTKVWDQIVGLQLDEYEQTELAL